MLIVFDTDKQYNSTKLYTKPFEKSCSLNSSPPENLGLVAHLVNSLAKKSFSVLFLCYIADIYIYIANLHSEVMHTEIIVCSCHGFGHQQDY